MTRPFERPAMVRITVDEKTSRELASAAKPIELCDSSGRLLGRLLPSADASMYENVEPPPMTDAERTRRRAGPFYTTDEVLRHLERRRDS